MKLSEFLTTFHLDADSADRRENKNRMRYDKVIAKTKGCKFSHRPTVYTYMTTLAKLK